MRQLRPFGDDRVLSGCIYCGDSPDTRDHVPSRVLLDEPFPENLPVVPSCRACNVSFSLDEEYLAALIDCAALGSAEPNSYHRTKVRRILERQPALAASLEAARTIDAAGVTTFTPDVQRVERVFLKLARGHAAFEMHSVEDDEPTSLVVLPLPLLNDAARTTFELPPAASLLPEFGSRALQRMVKHGVPSPSWIVVQPDRYRFLASPGPSRVVRIVVGEYLAAEVVWD